MNDGRMSSLFSVQLFGPDGELKVADQCEDCPECCDNCNCGTCPMKEETPNG